jgi:hypothetical protein
VYVRALYPIFKASQCILLCGAINEAHVIGRAVEEDEAYDCNRCGLGLCSCQKIVGSRDENANIGGGEPSRRNCPSCVDTEKRACADAYVSMILSRYGEIANQARYIVLLLNL